MAEALIETPIGFLHAVASNEGLQRLDFVRDTEPRGISAAAPEALTPAERILAETERQLTEYFAGERRDFDLPLAPEGSDFRKRAWRAIAAIPFGETVSYAAVAADAGAPGAYRAAGTACATNPIALIVPCHRVVGSDGALHGYGGGLDTKTWLLRHEGALDGIRGAQRALALA
jgi:methylated-DNA-[protein]-cysteine S-methyltransferase